jgi:hypothetical protein
MNLNVFAFAFTLICFIIQVIPTTETSSIQNLVSEIAYRVAVSIISPCRNHGRPIIKGLEQILQVQQLCLLLGELNRRPC